MAAVNSRGRMTTLGGIAVALLSLLVVRVWFLQVVNAESMDARAQAIRTRTVRIPPERGRIFDSQGRIVADNERLLTITVDRETVKDDSVRAELFSRLSGPLELPAEDIEIAFKSLRNDPLADIPLKVGVSEDTALFLRERGEDYPGVDVREDWKRDYLYAPLASHVIGFLGAIRESQLSLYLSLGYEPNELIGQFGVEQTYESELRGTPGYIKYEVDTLGNKLREIAYEPAIPGQDVVLSLDLAYQQFAEQALQTQLKVRQRTEAGKVYLAPGELDPGYAEVNYYKAPAGSVTMMNWATGEIIAMASYPTFDNRWFNAGISGSKFQSLFPNTQDPDQSILVNRAISGRYNLGSSFKPFVAYAALNAGQLPGGSTYRFKDEGTYTLESIDRSLCQQGVKCVFKNAVCSSSGSPCRYGWVDVEAALAVSSDAFFYKIGEQIMTQRNTNDILEQEVRKFGFGSSTGIDLPYEFSGALPSLALKKKLAESGAITEESARGYYVGDNVQFSIGQGLLSATPVQVARAYSVLASGGNVLRPHVVRYLLAPGTPDSKPGYADIENGRIIRDLRTSQVISTVDMSGDRREPILRGLKRVITGPGVTSDYYHKTTGEKLFANYPYEILPIAGKTGTAQGFNNLPWNDSSAFGSFSLALNRPFTVVAYLEKSGYGSQAAAPVAKCLWLAIAGQWRLPEVFPAEPLDVASTAVAKSQSMPNPQCLSTPYTGLRE